VADDYYACKKEQGAGSGMLCCITIKNSRGDWGTPIMSGRKYVGCKWSSELSPQSQGITVNDPPGGAGGTPADGSEVTLTCSAADGRA
jgi:hypothetical protein